MNEHETIRFGVFGLADLPQDLINCWNDHGEVMIPQAFRDISLYGFDKRMFVGFFSHWRKILLTLRNLGLGLSFVMHVKGTILCSNVLFSKPH